MRIQAWHIIVLVVVIVLVFGSNRLPDMAKSVGQSMKVFKKEIKDLREDDEDKQSPAQIQQPQEGTYLHPAHSAWPECCAEFRGLSAEMTFTRPNPMLSV